MTIRLRQPIHCDKNGPKGEDAGHQAFILRPGAFFYYAGKLYVGYAWCSRMHLGEKPMWDPTPVPLGATIDTSMGYYKFAKILKPSEGPGCNKTFAVLRFTHVIEMRDWWPKPRPKNWATLPENVRVKQELVIPSGYYLEHQWLGYPHLDLHPHLNPRRLRRVIDASPAMQQMRDVHPALRRSMERMYPILKR
ncbi:hypothetical protein KBA73_00945 [Patescibacteria group bacterium]|nr:hypothetical protein [Patescibacteria group bacterium]